MGKKSLKNIHWLSFVGRLQVNLFSLLGFSVFFKFSPRCVCYGFYNHTRKSFLSLFFFFLISPGSSSCPLASSPPKNPNCLPDTTGTLLTSGPR